MVRFKKTLSNWLNTKHIFIIQNEENFSEKATYKFTYAKIVFYGFLLFVAILALSFYLVNTALAQWFDPRFAEQETRKELVQMNLSLDSLEQELNSRDAFITSLKKVLQGDVTTDELAESDNAPVVKTPNFENTASIDSAFKAEFESGGDFLLMNDLSTESIRDIYFFSPIKGYNITAKFDPQNKHYGIDIVSNKDEPVKAIADGNVFFSSWTQDDGYVIAIQHRENLISVYKHNSTLTREVGDIVTAGDIISIIGNTGELTSGPHLHFELWFDGAAVNPEEVIYF